MKYRIPTQAQKIETLRNIRDGHEDALRALRNKPNWGKNEVDLATEHERVIADCNARINAFYKPAMII